MPPRAADTRFDIVTPEVKQALAAKKPKFEAVPRSGLLGRLNAFLPAMQSANVALEERIAREGSSAVDVESIPDKHGDLNGDVGPQIEFDLACGVLDLNDACAERAAERAAARATGIEDDVRALQARGGGADDRGGRLMDGETSSDESDDESGDVHIQEHVPGAAGGSLGAARSAPAPARPARGAVRSGGSSLIQVIDSGHDDSPVN